MSDSQKFDLTQRIRSTALELGLTRIGIAPAVTPTGYHQLLEWLAAGYAGEMHWIERRRGAYESPDGVMPGTRSVIVAALNYHHPGDVATGGRVSRYAWGTADYHSVVRDRLQALAAVVHACLPSVRTRVVVDTAPLLERDYARLAGIGWFGKNTMLISRSMGSWFFLGALLVDVELEYDDPEVQTWCGTCTRCLDACPTDAFPEPGVLDARRCISYLTIELRHAPIPMDLRKGIGHWVFGCDICQEVCPWNRFAPQETIPEFQAAAHLNPVDCRAVLRMTAAEFNSKFCATPLDRPGYSGIRRNAAIALGNMQDLAAESELTLALRDPDPILRGAAAWSLGQLRSQTAATTLKNHLAGESHLEVRHEIECALALLH